MNAVLAQPLLIRPSTTELEALMRDQGLCVSILLNTTPAQRIFDDDRARLQAHARDVYRRLELEPDQGLAAVLAARDIRAMIVIGGMDAYQNVEAIANGRQPYPGLQIPIVIVPASINNNLPGTDFSIGADTALNNIISALDKVKDTAGANKRAFVVEVMGYDCGYLALMAALASGAEGVYLPEEGLTLKQLAADVEGLRRGFEAGKRLSIVILNENASSTYTLDMLQKIMDAEGGGQFDVRSVRLGHVQRGGAPSPFDRILADVPCSASVDALRACDGQPHCRVVGLRGKHILTLDLATALTEIDWPHERPRQQWFMELRELTRIL